MTDAWLQQKGEHKKSFHHFCIYRDQPPDKRSYKDVAEKVGVTTRTIAELGRNNNWIERVRLYDNYVEEGHIKKNLLAIEEMNNRQAEDAVKIQRQAMHDYENAVEDTFSRASIESRKKAAVQTWEIGVKTERLARGAATEKIEQDGKIRQEHSGKIDVGKLDDEDRMLTKAVADALARQTKDQRKSE